MGDVIIDISVKLNYGSRCEPSAPNSHLRTPISELRTPNSHLPSPISPNCKFFFTL
jgi:hypothetical protein